ncbi:MAG TPA: SOS response-associated peptidase [Thermoplasmata archaeon]
MCGRFALTFVHGFWSRFSISDPPNLDLVARFNIAPTQQVTIVTSASPNTAVMMRWGLIPFWAKDVKIGSRMINARAETVAAKPAFRASLKRRRCIVPATGFYEWKKDSGSKRPFYIHLKDNAMFGFAGLYDRWKDQDGNETLSFTIITTKPNPMMEKIHNRMPVILREEHEQSWLRNEVLAKENLGKMFAAYPSSRMVAYEVSKDVNNPSVDSEHLIEPLRTLKAD